MSGFSIDFETQMRGPWESASPFLIEILQRLQAQLAPIFPLVDGIQSSGVTSSAIGLSGYPVSSILSTNTAGVPGFSNLLPCPIAFNAGTINTPAALTVNTNDYTPANLATTAVLRIAATGAINLTGLVAATMAQVILLVNIGTFAITLTHADALSAAANRWNCPGAANVVLAVPDSRWIWYDPTLGRWQVIS